MKIDALGRHILVELYNCDAEMLKSPKIVEKHMKQAALECGATIVASKFHHFSPWGVSGAVIISESHLTIHTWPEYGFAAVDLFTCGDINPWSGFDYLKKAFKSDKCESMEIQRGIVEKIRNNHPDDLGVITYKQVQ